MRDTFEIINSVKINTITQLNRGVGFLLKYDKDGCKVSGCRIVDTNDEVIEENEIKLHPNPAQDNLTIYLPHNKNDWIVSIYNMQGERLIRKKNFENEKIDVSTLLSGTYILSAKSSNATLKKIFVKI